MEGMLYKWTNYISGKLIMELLVVSVVVFVLRALASMTASLVLR